MKFALSLATATGLVLAAGQSFAADAIVYEPAPMAPAVAATYDWSGPYIGIFGGLAAGETDYEAGPAGGPVFIEASVSSSGFLGGVQAGYDWQFNNSWVFGAVADIAYTNYGPSIEISSPFGGDIDIESQLNYLGTVRARVGHTWDRSLLYVHGGFAYGQTEQTVESGGTEVFNDEQTRTGWTAGVGAEFLMTQRVSFGVEYAYVDLGSDEIDIDPGTDLEEDYSFHTLKAMINFRF